MKPILYSIGHGNKSILTFIEQLKESEIQRVYDVRSYPKSKYNPHFNQVELSQALNDAGIEYEWRGSTLGGLWRKGSPQEAITEIATLVRMGYKIAIMCSETDHKNCHRAYLGENALQPEFDKLGIEAEHIGEKAKPIKVVEAKVEPVDIQVRML